MNLSKRELVLTGLVIVLLAVNAGLVIKIDSAGKGDVPVKELDSYFVEEDNAKAQIAVHVTGEVKERGLVNIDEGSRALDAIRAAGGALDTADLDRINLAKVMQDGEKLHVPAVGEILDNNAYLGYNEANAKININTADVAQLDTLQGIGPVLAQRIVDFREREGRFERIEDIMKVSGIGPKVYENIKDRITVR
ncbi:MAG TPA: helix-hairpin-helix domain-containing protein [Bacillota bacterium]|jgi:competence protein ComEA|nr:helix-hairpin-helix domain-containing protein [Bacillota bacterium]